MRLYYAFLMCIFFNSSYAQILQNEVEAWDRTSPGYPFYSGGIIRECPTCETYVVIASTFKPSVALINSFKKISTSNGSTHQGVIMKRSQLLGSINEIVALDCQAPGSDRNIAYYINKPANKCILIPYEDEEHLLPILERMQAFLKSSNDVEVQVTALAQNEADQNLKNRFVSAMGHNAAWVVEFVEALITSWRVTSRSTELQNRK